jgi:hypothetical protein
MQDLTLYINKGSQVLFIIIYIYHFQAESAIHAF